jgi:hypothetical protein
MNKKLTKDFRKEVTGSILSPKRQALTLPSFYQILSENFFLNFLDLNFGEFCNHYKSKHTFINHL